MGNELQPLTFVAERCMRWLPRTGRSVARLAQRRGRYVVVVLVLWQATSAGCASHVHRLQQVRGHFYTGDLPGARGEVQRLLEKPGRDGDVLLLDQAVIELADGRPAEAERLLRHVRNRFEHLEQKALGESALSMVTDDTALAYAGEDHEKVLLLSLLALSNLMAGGGDAQAYALQIADKQQQLIRDTGGLEQHPELANVQVALGPYLRAALAEESRFNLDDAVRARTMVVTYQPEFRDGQADLQRAQFDVPAQPGHGVLYVFALTGRGPTKEEALEIPTQAALLIADRIISATGKHELPPTIAPIRVPKLVPRPNRVARVEVTINGVREGETATLVDVGRLALAHYEADYPAIVGRAVARRIIKKGAVYAVKDAVGAQRNPLADIALTLAGIAWEATEKPDTRCWGLLPDQIQVLRLELPVGEHRLGLAPADYRGPIGREEPALVRIEDGRNTYALAHFPDARLVGRIVTSGASSVP